MVMRVCRFSALAARVPSAQTADAGEGCLTAPHPNSGLGSMTRCRRVRMLLDGLWRHRRRIEFHRVVGQFPHGPHQIGTDVDRPCLPPGLAWLPIAVTDVVGVMKRVIPRDCGYRSLLPSVCNFSHASAFGSSITAPPDISGSLGTLF